MVLVSRADICFFARSSPNHGVWDISFSSPGTIHWSKLWSFSSPLVQRQIYQLLSVCIWQVSEGRKVSHQMFLETLGEILTLHRMPPPQSLKATALRRSHLSILQNGHQFQFQFRFHLFSFLACFCFDPLSSSSFMDQGVRFPWSICSSHFKITGRLVNTSD